MGRFDEAIEYDERAIRAARDANDPGAELAAYNGLLYALICAHRLGEVDARAGEALELADRTGQSALRLETLAAIADLDLCVGSLASASRLADAVIASAEEVGHAPALVRAVAARAEICTHQSEYERAEGLAVRAMGLARDLGDGFLILYALFLLALAKGNLGKVSEALGALDEIASMAARNGDTFWLSRVPNCVGWLRRELGDFAGAAEHDRRGVDVADDHSLDEVRANSLVNLALDARHCPSDVTPADALSEARRIAELEGYMSWRFGIRIEAAAAEHWLGEGDLEKAEAHARRALKVAASYESRKYIAVARSVLAEVDARRGDLAGARVNLEAAACVLREFPAPLVAWKVYAALGRACASAGDAGAARQAYEEAARVVDAIAANVSDDHLRSTFLGWDAVRSIREGNE